MGMTMASAEAAMSLPNRADQTWSGDFQALQATATTTTIKKIANRIEILAASDSPRRRRGVAISCCGEVTSTRSGVNRIWKNSRMYCIRSLFEDEDGAHQQGSQDGRQHRRPDEQRLPAQRRRSRTYRAAAVDRRTGRAPDGHGRLLSPP